MRAPAWWQVFRYRVRLAWRALFPGPVRHYGDDGTIHRTGEVNVELDRSGKVVSVWFRCHLVPFTQHVVDEGRAEDMRSIRPETLPRITAIDFVERSKSTSARGTRAGMWLLAWVLAAALVQTSALAASPDPVDIPRPAWCHAGWQCIPTALAVENQVQKELLERDLVICESRCSSWGLCMGIGGATTLGVQDSQVSLTSGPSAGVLFGYRFGSFRRRPPP